MWHFMYSFPYLLFNCRSLFELILCRVYAFIKTRFCCMDFLEKIRCSVQLKVLNEPWFQYFSFNTLGSAEHCKSIKFIRLSKKKILLYIYFQSLTHMPTRHKYIFLYTCSYTCILSKYRLDLVSLKPMEFVHF